VFYIASNLMVPPALFSAAPRLRFSSTVRLLFALLGISAITAQPSRVCAEEGGWEYQPYRVQALLAIDAPGGLTENWAVELPTYLQQRADIALAPLWRVDLKLATGVKRRHVFDNLAATKPPLPKEFPEHED
jgi:hypothetical protein